jgi:hypothetical protein
MENNNNQYPEGAEQVKFDSLQKVDPEKEEATVAETTDEANEVIDVDAKPVEEEDTNEYVNKSGATFENVKLFTITQDDVTRYFQQNILGIPASCDYIRGDGARDNAYVLMRVAIPTKYASQKATQKVNNPYMQSQLESSNAGTYLAQEVYDNVAPFMYPKNMNDVNLKPEVVDYLTRIGLTPERYNKYINDYVEPCLSRDPDTGAEIFAFVLQADVIIQDMINVNPKNEKKYGNFEILKVTGGDAITDNFGRVLSSTPISWKCSIDMEAVGGYNGNFNVSMNSIFANAQQK